MPNTYIVGQVVLLRSRLSDPSTGDPDDPATQTTVDDPSEAMTVYLPDGTSVSVSGIQHVGTGIYTWEFTPSQSGWHEYVDQSNGAARGRGRNRFYASPVP